MAKITLLFSIGLLFQQGSCQSIPSAAQVDTAKSLVTTLISSNVIAQEKIFIAGLVRLAFHDCVGQGHCDGCIDHTLDDNKGLSTYTNQLDPLYDTHAASIGMSRADFYILAAYTALEAATELEGDKFTGTMQFGRVDCSSHPTEDETDPGFPKATWDFEKAHTFFVNEFGFTDRQQSVALLGAHTLGRCRTDNSGFEGRWVKGKSNGVRNTDVLDNQYYLQLRGNWTQVQIAESGKWQWQRPGTTANVKADATKSIQPNMFLNVDVGMVFKVDTDIGNGVGPPLDETTGENECLVIVENNQCIAADPAECCAKAVANTGNQNNGNKFKKYTNQLNSSPLTPNQQFIQDFTEVFRKMTHDKNDAVSALSDPVSS